MKNTKFQLNISKIVKEDHYCVFSAQSNSGSVVWECDWEANCTDFTVSSENGDFTWYKRKGSTLSGGTGPDGDHTTGSGELLHSILT